MLKVAITGGIGSGKTYISKVFEALSVPVFNADLEAKSLYELPEIIQEVREIIPDTFNPDTQSLDLKRLTEIVFLDSEKLQLLNAVIHPKVMNKYKIWLKEHADCTYTVLESAIIFEIGWAQYFDFIIGVDSELETRYERIKACRNLSQEDFFQRVSLQLDNQEKLNRCNAVICNFKNSEILTQVLALDEQIRTPDFDQYPDLSIPIDNPPQIAL